MSAKKRILMSNFSILYLVSLAAVFFLFYVVSRAFKNIGFVRKFSGLLNVLIILVVIHYAVTALSHAYPSVNNPHIYNNIAKGLKSLLFLFGAFVAIRLIDYTFFELYLIKSKYIRIPAIFRDILILMLLIIVILSILSIQYGVHPMTLVTTSAILSAIIGLSLQDVLVNIIAGVALHIEKPFTEGDFIAVGDKMGTVVEMSWRATHIMTLDNNHLIIPNSAISKAEIKNFQKPTPEIMISVKVGVEYGAAPNAVKQILLGCTEGIDSIMQNPPPVVRLVDYSDSAINYEIFLWVTDRIVYAETMDKVRTRIWYALKRHNMQIPYPIRDIYTHEISKNDAIERERLEFDERTAVLRNVEIFKPLQDTEIKTLAAAAAKNFFAAGETLVKQGDEGDSLFIIIDGRASVSIADPDGVKTITAELGQGAFFGEMSLLTGEKRAATVTAECDMEIMEITRDEFSEVIIKNSAIAGQLSGILASRQLSNVNLLLANAGKGKIEGKEKEFFDKFLGSIQKFFKLK